jgi:hypothetical protein
MTQETVQCISLKWTPSPFNELEWFIHGNEFKKSDLIKNDTLVIEFEFREFTTENRAIQLTKRLLTHYNAEWITFSEPAWTINLDLLRKSINKIPYLAWMTGIANPTIDIDYTTQPFNENNKFTRVRLTMTPDSIKKPDKIFLSHKGVDKPRIREYKAALEIVGFQTWLDEDAMVAGVELERELLKGFKDSCAAVFFITKNYEDKGFLSTEIDYAIQEKRQKGKSFSIITLALQDSCEEKVIIPDLLMQYIWKSPKSDLEGFCEIIKALPLKIQTINWK